MNKISSPDDEKLLYDVSARLIIKMGYALLKSENTDEKKYDTLFEIAKTFSMTIPSEVYSAVFKIFHKIFRDNPTKYSELVNWWGLDNFRKEDYNRETLSDEKTVMSIVEQAYVARARSLLPRILDDGTTYFDKEKAKEFLEKLDKLEETHPQYQYPPYYKARLLLELGDEENVLSLLLPFVKKKRNYFWVWDILSEVFPDDQERKFACYCRGLLCNTPEEMLVKLRTKIIPFFLNKQMWDEAKTELLFIQHIYAKKGWKTTEYIESLTEEEWYLAANVKVDNKPVYRKFASYAEEIMLYDTPEVPVIVTFVNPEKKILNFTASDDTFGFFKYDRFFDEIRVADTLKIRFVKKEMQGYYQVISAKKYDDPNLKSIYAKEFNGAVKMREGSTFGFVDDVFLTSALCKQSNLTNGCVTSGCAIKNFDAKKNQWSWKAYEIQNFDKEVIDENTA